MTGFEPSKIAAKLSEKSWGCEVDMWSSCKRDWSQSTLVRTTTMLLYSALILLRDTRHCLCEDQATRLEPK